MKRRYGDTYTKLTLKGKALAAYNNISNIDIYEYTDKAYKIKPEYQHLWGEDVNDDTIIWDCDLGYYADQWETTETDLYDQLETCYVYSAEGTAFKTDHLMTEEELVEWLIAVVFG